MNTNTPENRPFMAINALSKIFHNRISELACERGLNESYRHLLFHLSRNEGATQLTLARATNLKPPTISITLKKMEEEGYVKRIPDDIDLRAVRVYMTEKGKAFDEASRQLVQTMDREAVKDMSNAEIEQLMSLLGRVFFNLTGKKPCKFDKK